MESKRKILFLDIDGVLAGYDFLKTGKGFIDPEKVALLNTLEDAEIVISSSWGTTAKDPLEKLGLKLPIVGYTEHYHQDWVCRGNEIDKWLHDNCDGMHTKYGPQWTTDTVHDNHCEETHRFSRGRNRSHAFYF